MLLWSSSLTPKGMSPLEGSSGHLIYLHKKLISSTIFKSKQFETIWFVQQLGISWTNSRCDGKAVGLISSEAFNKRPFLLLSSLYSKFLFGTVDESLGIKEYMN